MIIRIYNNEVIYLLIHAGLSAALTAGEPSTPLAVAVFSVIYCGTAICLALLLEYSLLLGEVAHRFQVCLLRVFCLEYSVLFNK